jgi:hypothetical protein
MRVTGAGQILRRAAELHEHGRLCDHLTRVRRDDNAKRSYARYITLAREAAAVGDAVEIALAAARPKMIATLDSFRDTLEDLGGGLGLTDPVSGPVVLALK